MRIIKLGIISLVAFAMMITLISLFFPSHVRISKAINIGAPADSVLRRLQTMSRWHPAYDSSGGLPDTVLAGNRISPGEIDYTLLAEQNGSVRNGWKILSGLNPDSVTVQWYMDFKLRWYPWEKFSSMLFEGRYGPHMETGLGRLKQLAEANHPSIK